MTKRIPLLKTAAAALAASVAFAFAVPAFAQPGLYPHDDGRLDGGPPLFSGQDDDFGVDRGRDYRGRDDWARRKPDFQDAQRDCSIAGIRRVWNQGFYSAQYHESPRLIDGRNGWEMVGRMRLHDRKGYAYVDTWCSIGRDGAAYIEMGRSKR